MESLPRLRRHSKSVEPLVKVVREDVTSGLALIRMAGIPKELWTQTKFLSKRPVENTFGVVETPETSGLILSGVTSIVNSPEASGATPHRVQAPKTQRDLTPRRPKSHAKTPRRKDFGLEVIDDTAVASFEDRFVKIKWGFLSRREI